MAKKSGGSIFSSTHGGKGPIKTVGSGKGGFTMPGAHPAKNSPFSKI